MKINKCPYCIYVTDIKCNLLRHINAKHKFENSSKTFSKQNEENVEVLEENVEDLHKNVEIIRDTFRIVEDNKICLDDKFEKVNLMCCRCFKKYKTKKFLIKHEEKCKGVDELTCSKCMKSFPSRSSKSHHIKRNTCKARSIIFARDPNCQNSSKCNIINNIQTQNNIQNNINNQNIIINNFGNERIDHISHEDILKMLMAGINTLPMYIEKKHFDKNFPENNNIIYTKENKCKVLENNCWKEKDIGLLSSKLIKDNTQVLLLHCDKTEIEMTEQMMDDDLFERIKNKLIIIYNKTDNEKYNQIVNLIKDILKSSKE